MEKCCDFLLGASDPEVEGRLGALADETGPLDRRYTQEEDFFLTLDQAYTVGPFSIHHDVRDPEPSEQYVQVIRELVKAWSDQVPGVFRGLSWYFDPKDLFHPLFVQVLSAEDRRYLFVLRPDLTYRGKPASLLEPGTNDRTPRYSTNRLFLESEVLPLERQDRVSGQTHLYLTKLFDQTFQGDTGRGYLVQGRWLDREITRILSRAALPPGTRTFPHYPLRCRHETLSVRCTTPTSEGRRRAAGVLETAWPLVSPWAQRIQTDLRDDPYREDHPLVDLLRDHWGAQIASRWGTYRVEPYLNEQEQKEFYYHGN